MEGLYQDKYEAADRLLFDGQELDFTANLNYSQVRWLYFIANTSIRRCYTESPYTIFPEALSHARLLLLLTSVYF